MPGNDRSDERLPEAENYVEGLLRTMGEDPAREGLLRTPERVVRALRFLTDGYRQNVDELFNDAFFAEPYDEMVVVRDIELYSLCVPSNQFVNTVGGARRAARVRVGDRLWTLEGGVARETTVTAVGRRSTRELVEVVSDEGAFRVTPLERLDGVTRGCTVRRMATERGAGAPKSSSINVRCDPDLVAALDAEAARLSKAAGGANITRSETARLVLRRALSAPAEKPVSSKPRAKGKAR